MTSFLRVSFPFYAFKSLPLIVNSLLCSVLNNNIQCTGTVTFSIKHYSATDCVRRDKLRLFCVLLIYIKINIFVAEVFSKLRILATLKDFLEY